MLPASYGCIQEVLMAQPEENRGNGMYHTHPLPPHFSLYLVQLSR